MITGSDTLDRLYRAILDRRGADPEISYTARLFARGRAKIAQKLGEEAIETVIEAMKNDPAKLAEESADLLYHLLVLWADAGLKPEDVYQVLADREGTSGIAEKASRKKEGTMSGDENQGSYDDNNIFARILRGEIPAQKVYEDDHVLAILDIHPQAPTHILVMPKGKYVSFDDFAAKASDAEITALTRATGRIARDNGVSDTGYRLILNHGPHSHQEVPHLHIHLLGGKPMGPLLQRNNI